MVADVELVRRHLESEKYKRLQRTAATDFDTYKVCAGTCVCLVAFNNEGLACRATVDACSVGLAARGGLVERCVPACA